MAIKDEREAQFEWSIRPYLSTMQCWASVGQMGAFYAPVLGA